MPGDGKRREVALSRQRSTQWTVEMHAWRSEVPRKRTRPVIQETLKQTQGSNQRSRGDDGLTQPREMSPGRAREKERSQQVFRGDTWNPGRS